MSTVCNELSVGNAEFTFPVAGKEIRFSLTKTGFKIPGQKELGELTGLKGAALKRAHFTLRMDAGKKLNAAIAANMTEGKIIARAVSVTKGEEVKVTFTPVGDLVAPPNAKGKAAAKEAADKAAAEAVTKAAEKLVAAGKFATMEEAIAAIA